MILSERIGAVVKHSGLSIPKFSEKMGFKTPQTVRELIGGRTKSLSYAVKSKILESYPEINGVWLETGEGEMLNPTPQERYKVGIGIGKQQGGKNDFKIEIKEEDSIAAERFEKEIIDLQKEIDYLRELLAEKNARLAEKDERIAELKERIEEFKSKH